MRKNKLISSVLTLAMVFNLLPVSALAEPAEVKYKDGIYTGTATVKDVDGDFDDYKLTVEVSVSDGKITDITAEPDESEYSDDNDAYWNYAINGRKRSGTFYESVISQIINNQNTDADAVSGATCTSDAIIEAVKNALADAVDSSSETVSSGYALVNIPYDKFYGAEGTTNFDTDAISSATNKVGNYGKAGGAFHSGTTAGIAEDGSVTAVGGENGAHLEGVTWPVKVNDISALKALGGVEITDESKVTVATAKKGKTSATELEGAAALTEAPAYSYYILTEEPDYYVTLDIDGETVEFSGLVGEVKELDKLDVDVSYATHWGDVRFDFAGAEEVADKQVNAVVITADDGTTGGLVHLYNIWSYNSLAWNVANVKGLDGVKVTNIRYYCNDKEGNYYVYDYPVELDILPFYTGEVTAAFADDSTITLAGLPDDIKNPTATVYYTSGERGAAYEYLTPTHIDPEDGDVEPDTTEVVDGKIALAEKPENGKTYTIVIGSDNYVAITVSAKYIEAEDEVDKTALEAAVDTAEAIDSDKYTDETVEALNEVLENAKEILAKEDATQEEIDAATAKVNEAVEALVEKTEEQKEDDSKTQDDSKTDNDKKTDADESNTDNTGSDKSSDDKQADNTNVTDNNSKTDNNNVAPATTTNTNINTPVKTGDNTNIWGIFSAIIVALGGLGLSIKLKKKETEE